MSARDAMPDGGDVTDAILVVVIVTAIGFVAINALATTADVVDPIGADGDEEQFNITVDDAVQIADGGAFNTLDVYNSRGYAAQFGSNGGNVTGNFSDAGNGGSLTVSVHARLADNASVANTYHIANLGNGSASLQFDNGSYRAVYTNGTNQSAVTATAADPKNFTHVALRSNGTHIEIAVNGSVRNETVLGNGGQILNANGLYGTVDELREFDNAVSDTTLSELNSTPIRGQPSETRSARLLLDNRSGTTAGTLFEPGDAQLSGDASFVSSGLPRTEIPDADYSVGLDGVLSVDSGSAFSVNPVIFVTYDQAKGGEGITDGVVAVMDLVGVAFLVILLGTAVARLQQTREA